MFLPVYSNTDTSPVSASGSTSQLLLRWDAIVGVASAKFQNLLSSRQYVKLKNNFQISTPSSIKQRSSFPPLMAVEIFLKKLVKYVA